MMIDKRYHEESLIVADPVMNPYVSNYSLTSSYVKPFISVLPNH